ncbi:MAG: DAK2 domain-containing protein [Pseudonocardiaceae bacterium]|nr:DAK2 domain-containing protein [Pseudonocardiaceae bacterium]
MLQALDEATVRRWAEACCDALAAHRDEIDRLNVFPVPDSDTGTNLLATMRAASDAVRRHAEGTGLGAVLAVLARGALIGARGNSGVILSQVLRGLAETVGNGAAATGAVLRDALRRADELATAAVSDPVPGTVLSVLHAAADGAHDSTSDSLGDVLAAAAAAAARALDETPRQLAVLARAGVVDAGGRGLVVLLEVLHGVVTGHPVDRGTADPGVPARGAPALRATREAGSNEYDYEVMYLLDGSDDDRVAALRSELGGVGDCVAVVGSGAGPDQMWNVHVHCTDIGAAIESGVRAGRPHRITVIRFDDQTAEAAADARFVTENTVLAMVVGDGTAELFRGEGALTAPGTSTLGELLAVLAGSRARHVTMLPGAGAATPVAEAAAEQARDAGQDVVVVPTASPVQALAALAVHDPARRPGDDVVAMAEAAAATRRGELTVAISEALTWVGRCQLGDILGMIDDEVVLIEAEPLAAARGLLELMLSSGGELVTVLLGRDAPEGVAGGLAEHLRAVHPEVELAVYTGGQPRNILQVGVE